MSGTWMKSAAVTALAVGMCAFSGGPTAAAAPPGFPDLDAFTDAPAHLTYSRPDKSANGFSFFRTPDGLSCMVGSLIRCSGSLPGVPVAEYGDCAAVYQTYEAASRSEPFRLERAGECQRATDELLDVGQKLTFDTGYSTTCVVGRDQLTACISNDHGFVLKPSGTWVF